MMFSHKPKIQYDRYDSYFYIRWVCDEYSSITESGGVSSFESGFFFSLYFIDRVLCFYQVSQSEKNIPNLLIDLQGTFP